MKDRRLIARPDFDPSKATELSADLAPAVDLVKELIAGYAETGPGSSKKLCQKFLDHAAKDRVGIIGFSQDVLPHPIAVSNEEVSGKRKFMLMVNPLLYRQMGDTRTSLEAERRVLNAVRDIVREIDRAVEQGLPIMTNAEYQRLISLALQGRN